MLQIEIIDSRKALLSRCKSVINREDDLQVTFSEVTKLAMQEYVISYTKRDWNKVGDISFASNLINSLENLLIERIKEGKA